MRRPTAVIGFTLLIALSVARFLPDFPCLLLAGLLTVFALAALVLRPRHSGGTLARCCEYAVAILLTAAFACAALPLYNVTRVAPVVTALDGRSAVVRGVIVSVPETAGNSTRFLLRVDECDIDGAPTGFTARFTATDSELYEPYDRVEARVVFEDLRTSLTDSGASSALARGVILAARQSGALRLTATDDRSIEATMLRANMTLSAAIRRMIPDQDGAVAAAVTLGDTGSISDETADAFRATGTTHILALSGMHLTLLTEALLAVLGLLGLPKRARFAAAIAAVLAYMLLTGFPYSLARAGVMLILTLLGRIFYFETDALSSLGAAAGLLCLVNPYAASDVGFQLSCAATLGILLFADPMADLVLRRLPVPDKRPVRRLLLRFARGAVRGIATSFAASLLALPVQIAAFGTVSLLSLLATLLVGWLLPFIMLPGLAGALLFPVGYLDWLARALAWVAGTAASWMRDAVAALASHPFAAVWAREPYVLAWGVIAAAGFLLLRKTRVRRTQRVVFMLASFAILLTGTLLNLALTRGVTAVSVVLEPDAAGVAVIRGGSAVYIGDMNDSADRYYADAERGGTALSCAVLFDADDWLVRHLAEDEPGSVVLTDGGEVPLDGSALTLAEGSLLTFGDGAGHHAAVLTSGGASVVVLSDGFDAARLPAAYARPGMLVLLGEADGLGGLRPQNAVILGEHGYAERIALLGGGASLLRPVGGDPVLYRAVTRYGDDWRFETEQR